MLQLSLSDLEVHMLNKQLQFYTDKNAKNWSNLLKLSIDYFL